MQKKEAIVIGAGLGGLTAAYRLQKAGFSVQVLEANGFPGGRVRSLEKDGFIMDSGADAIAYEYYPEYLQLCDDLGIRGEVVQPPSIISTIKNGAVIDVNLEQPLSLPFNPLLSLAAKVKLAMGFLKIKRKKLIGGLSISHLHLNAQDDDPSRSALDFGREYFGEEVTDYVINPTAKIHNSLGPNHTSTVDIRYAITPMTIGALKGGQARLPTMLSERLDVHYHCRVKSVKKIDSGKVKVNYINGSNQTIESEFDGCVIATMYDNIAEVFPWFKQLTEEYKSQLRYMCFHKVHLAYDIRPETRSFVVQVPDREDDEMMMIFLDHNKCVDRAPPGKSLFLPMMGGRAAEKYVDWSDEQFVDWGREKIEGLYPELRGHFLFSEVVRWPIVTQLNEPGYYRRVVPILEQLRDDDSIQIACDMFSKSSQETAVSWGNRAANNLIANFS